jgi:hypothetical protein
VSDGEAAEVHELLMRLLLAPEAERDPLLARAAASRPAVAVEARRAFGEVVALLEHLPDDADAARAELAALATLDPLVAGAVEHVLGQALPSLPPPGAGEFLPASPSEPTPFTVFGNYLIVRRLGGGGTGVVFLALDLRFADRQPRALKLLHPLPDPDNPADARRIERFKDEAAILYKLAPEIDIVGVRDYDVAPRPFIAMDFVEGGSLTDTLRSADGTWPGRGRARAVAAAELVRRVALALHGAHGYGVFHLDLKPDNVLLHERRGPLLADFSIAWRADGDGNAVPAVGTVAYMAPEQAGGGRTVKPVPVDVYGLGAILYEALTGKPPLPVLKGEKLSDALKRVRAERPRPPRALDPSVPADLEAVCLKCLREEPDGRYDSAREVADDLAAFLRGDRPAAARWPWHRRARHFVRRRRSALSLGLLAVGLVVSLVVLSLERARAAEKEAYRLKEDARRAREANLKEVIDGARRGAERGDWAEALKQYARAAGGLAAADPGRLALEVERLPGWFLYRSRQEVADELDRLDGFASLGPKERAKVRVYRADLRLSGEGRSSEVLDPLRECLAGGALDPPDRLYAEALAANSAREGLAKLRELVDKHRRHYRGRVALLGLLFVRGELPELRDALRLHEELFPGDPTAAVMGAWLDVLQHDDVAGAAARIDAAAGRLGADRAARMQTFLGEWAKMLRAVGKDEAPGLDAILRLRAAVGGDRDVFSMNVPTVCWLKEHWGAALGAFTYSALGGFVRQPLRTLERWQKISEDNPDAAFLTQRALSECAVARRADQQGLKQESLEHAGRAVDLAYRAANSTTPTLMPRSEWRYKALLLAVATDAAFLETRGEPVEPWRERRLADGILRAVTDGRDHADFRNQQLPRLADCLSQVAASSPKAVLSTLRRKLLIEWTQEEPRNAIPYRLWADQALREAHPETVLAVLEHWKANNPDRKDAALEATAARALEQLGRNLKLGTAPAPPR